MSTRSKLLEDIQAFLAASEMEPKDFGWRAARCTSLVDRLEKGGDVTTRIMDNIYTFMDKNFHLTTNQKEQSNESTSSE